jgi:signal transduction histidine kinase
VTGAAPEKVAATGSRRRGRSLTRRMIGIAALWIGVLLLLGGFALDRVLSRSIVASFDAQLEYVLNAMIAASEIGPGGEVRFSRAPADQRFLETYSGAYFQIANLGIRACPVDPSSTLCTRSRSLWDRALNIGDRREGANLRAYDSEEFEGEPLRIVERDVILPGSSVRWRYQVAQSRDAINDQIRELRSILVRSFAVLGFGLLVLAALQAFYGLWPLRRVRREVAAIRSGSQVRISDHFPNEINPLVEEINELLAHSEAQAEEARRHAGNLAHALKTPLTVITNAATANAPDLTDTVCREASTMRRQVDHHLARARAIGRRASVQARVVTWDSAQAVQRAVDRLYDNVTIDLAGDRNVEVRVERQDLDEMLGNLVENAAKYGGGRVFVTVEPAVDGFVEILIEDDGPGIAQAERDAIFARGARLDTTGKPGTGLGLAIVRDVAEIYGGTVDLAASEDLGGLLARLRLPAG